MANNMNFDATNETFKEILAKGNLFKVPSFQRDYSWTVDELDDLWTDLQTALTEKTNHYMGYLVLQAQDAEKNKVFIIDGQQRISTITIMIAVALKKIMAFADSGDNDAQKRYDALRSNYLGYLDPVSLIANAKLELNRHNNSFFQDYVLAFQKFPKRVIIDTNKLIKTTFEFFESRIDSLNYKESSAYAKLIEDIAKTLFFTVITVTDELNAFRVFETLNARGVQLSSSDLLKNYIMSVVYESSKKEEELNKIEEKWEKIVKLLGTDKFPEFLRYHWNSFNRTIGKTDLFKTLRKAITTKANVFDLITAMEINANLYAALQNGRDEMWNGMSSDFKTDLDILTIFNIKQHIPLLFAVNKHIPNHMEKIVHLIKVFSFRYNVICEKQANEQTSLYNDIAIKISSQKITEIAEIKNALLTLYPEDKAFTGAFTEKILDINNQRNKKVVKYILCCFEKQLEQNPVDMYDASVTIEHIFPENPEEGWPEFRSVADHRIVFRLGNYTLLSLNDNKSLKNNPYSEKRQVYLNSAFGITRDIANKNEDWNNNAIGRRQQNMAKMATTIWRMG